MIPINDVAREAIQSDVGKLLFGLRDTIDQLISIRVREFGPLLDDEFAELMAIKLNLDMLLSDIRETRKFKVIRNGKT